MWEWVQKAQRDRSMRLGEERMARYYIAISGQVVDYATGGYPALVQAAGRIVAGGTPQQTAIVEGTRSAFPVPAARTAADPGIERRHSYIGSLVVCMLEEVGRMDTRTVAAELVGGHAYNRSKVLLVAMP